MTFMLLQKYCSARDKENKVLGVGRYMSTFANDSCVNNDRYSSLDIHYGDLVRRFL